MNPLKLFLASTALAMAASSNAHAGDGVINGGKLDLLVYFDYQEPDPTTWEPVFDEFSKLLLNATEGGLQLGTVSFTKCSDQKDQADIWVRSTTGGASAHRNGLGAPGRHIFISQTHKSSSGDTLGQFGLLHEAGHYLWGCFDEYKGFVGNTPAMLEEQFCSSSGDTISCPMDGGAAIALNNERTEFCTQSSLGFADSQHNQASANGVGVAIRTTQEYVLAQSCWERIQASGNGGLIAPATAPSQTQPAHQLVVYDYTGFLGSLAIALVIDVSGSMGPQNKMQLAKAGAQAGVGLMNDGDSIALVKFNDVAQVLVPTTTIDAQSKNAVINVIGSLQPGGGTAIGAGVLTGLGQLNGTGGCEQLIVLLTDGESLNGNLAGNDPSVLAQLQASGAKVFSIALGNQASTQELIPLTTVSDGKLFTATTAGELPGIFSEIFAEASGGITIAQADEQFIGASQTATETFDISDFSTSARVVLNHPLGASQSLILTSPSGLVIDTANPPSGNIVFNSNVQTSVSIPNPETGTWTAAITNQQGANSTYDFLVFVDSSQLQVGASLAQSNVTFPEPAHLEVSVIAGVPVGGASVNATVTRPDASIVNIVLHDDGLAVHGDSDADDGIYSALFANYNGDGSYAIDVSVDNASGAGAASLECFVFGLGEEGLTSEPIAPFVAKTNQSVTVSGFAPVANASAGLIAHLALPELGTVQVDASAPTAVAGFALEVAADEALILRQLVFDVADTDDIELLGRLALHRDLNGDGVIDVPSVPLALAQVVGNTVVFAQASGDLVMLDAGDSPFFIITAGDGLIEVDTASMAPVGSAPGGSGPWNMGAALTSLSLALLAAALVAAARLMPAAVRQRRLGFALSMLLCLSLSTGCSRFLNTSDGGSATAAPTFDFTMSLAATDVDGMGAVLGAPAAISGADLSFDFTLQ